MTAIRQPFSVRNLIFLAGLIAVVLLLSFQVSIITTDPNIGDEDAAAYAIQARHLYSGKGLTSDVIWHHIKLYQSLERPEDYWPPLQSILTALSFLFGEDAPWASKLVNLFGFYILVFLVAVIGSRLFSKPVGGLAALMCLMSSELTHYGLSGRNEIFFIVFLLLSTYLFARFFSFANVYLSALACGAFSGLAFLQRHIALLLLPALGVSIMGSWCLFREQVSLRSSMHSGLRILGFCVLGFALITIPFLIRNCITFGHALPPVASELSRLYTSAYVENPSLRHIDADLSHYGFFKKAHFQNARTSIPAWDWFRKGLSELQILMLMFKRGYVFPTILIGSAVMAIFFSGQPAGAVWLLFISFLFLNIAVIPIYAHVEQRYFVFIVPFCSLFSAAFFEKLYVWVRDNGVLGTAGYRINCFRAALSLFLIFSLLLPCMHYYSKRIKEAGKEAISTTVGNWMRGNIPANSVVMCPMPYRFAYHAHRPTVLTPEDTAEVTQKIVDHYNVSHLVLLQGQVTLSQKRQRERLLGRRLVLIKPFPSALVFRLNPL